jgi:hypothetical protein
MTEPSSAPPEAKSYTPVVLRVLLAATLLIPGIIGLLAFSLISGYWMFSGFRFPEPDRSIMPFFIFIAETAVLFSVVTLAIVLRYARWRKAPVASLVLAVISLLVIAIGLQMMIDALGSVDAKDMPGLVIISGIIAAAVSAPPFSHWWGSAKQSQTPTN